MPVTWRGCRAPPSDAQAPRALWPDARSVVVVGLNYGPAHDPLRLLDAPTRGIVSAYAQGRDYHDVLKGRLRRLAQLRRPTPSAQR